MSGEYAYKTTKKVCPFSRDDCPYVSREDGKLICDDYEVNIINGDAACFEFYLIKNEITQEIKYVCEMYLLDYMMKYKIEYLFDEIELDSLLKGGQRVANIICSDYYGFEYEIPLKNKYTDPISVEIDIGDAGELEFTEAGLFIFLFIEATHRLYEK